MLLRLAPVTVVSYAIGGEVSGLTSAGLKLTLNSGTATEQSVDVATNAASYNFATGLTSGSHYAVSIAASPTGLNCTLANPSGTVGSSNVVNVDVVCVTAMNVMTYSGITATNTGPATATLTTSDTGCALTSASFVMPPGNLPPDVSLPHGAFSFAVDNCAPGATLTVQVDYPNTPSLAGMRLWKYLGGTWSTYAATINGQTVTYTVTDGGAGDADDSINGIIVDPAGPGITITASSGNALAVPTLNQWLLLALGLWLAVVGLWRLRGAARSGYSG
jgi:hypothetical protein